MRNILTQKAWLQIGGWSGWGSAFSLGYCWPPPWRSKVSWKGLLGSGGWTTCLLGLGGGEWLPTYSTAVPWHIRSAKVSFLDFKLCIESQSSEFSQTEGWVSSPCNLCETEARVKEKTVKREGKARGALGPSTGTPKGCQPDWSYLRESVQELVLLRQQTCAERPVLVPIPHLVPSMCPEESRVTHRILPCERLIHKHTVARPCWLQSSDPQPLQQPVHGAKS